VVPTRVLLQGQLELADSAFDLYLQDYVHGLLFSQAVAHLNYLEAPNLTQVVARFQGLLEVLNLLEHQLSPD
jgi:hypothetical protein